MIAICLAVLIARFIFLCTFCRTPVFLRGMILPVSVTKLDNTLTSLKSRHSVRIFVERSSFRFGGFTKVPRFASRPSVNIGPSDASRGARSSVSYLCPGKNMRCFNIRSIRTFGSAFSRLGPPPSAASSSAASAAAEPTPEPTAPPASAWRNCDVRSSMSARSIFGFGVDVDAPSSSPLDDDDSSSSLDATRDEAWSARDAIGAGSRTHARREPPCVSALPARRQTATNAIAMRARGLARRRCAPNPKTIDALDDSMFSSSRNRSFAASQRRGARADARTRARCPSAAAFVKDGKLAAFAARYPHVEVTTETRRGLHPHMRGEFRSGETKDVSLRRFDESEILFQLRYIVSEKGMKNAAKNSIRGDRKMTKTPSVQGKWRPGMWERGAGGGAAAAAAGGVAS
eukprot:31365-Pelagococcus_subviridis.AAC.7